MATGSFIGILAACWVATVYGRALSEESPKGQFQIVIEPNHRLDSGLLHGFRVQFRSKGDGRTFFVETKSVEANRLQGPFLWSPQDEFVLLPDEGIGSETRTNARRAVCLGAGCTWHEALVPLETRTMVWLDRFRVLGDFHGSEAVNKVIIFDGKTGKTGDVLTNHGADGYQLLTADGRRALVAKIRDSGGQTHSGRRRLISCLQLDLGSLKAVPAACPQGTTLPEEPGS
jgi:hypothetical protein